MLLKLRNTLSVWAALVMSAVDTKSANTAVAAMESFLLGTGNLLGYETAGE
jgi:hypothetical protein